MRLATLAPGKVNLCLFVGEPRADGLHPLVSVVQPVALADELELTPAEHDEVVCPGVHGPNLAARAIALFREATGWEGPPVRIAITKRVPVAAGMGGGSSDAAATLRLLAAAAGTAVPSELAPLLGSDVPALLEAGPALVTGAGEHVERLPDAAGFGLVIVLSEHALSTPDVYREADRLGVRPLDELARIEGEVRAGARPAVNDLEAPARSLCPPIGVALSAVRAAGAETAMVSGSGPTVFGVFADLERAEAAAAALPRALAVGPAAPMAVAVRELR